jgi:hypothetical protein
VLAQPFRTGTEQECALRVGFRPFAEPSGNARFLRTAAVHCVVFTWLKSPEGDVHLPEGGGAKLTRRSMGTRVLRRPSVDRGLPVMAGRGSRLVLDPLQRAFRKLCGGPDGPITIRLT